MPSRQGGWGSLTQSKASLSILFSPSTDWTRPTHEGGQSALLTQFPDSNVGLMLKPHGDHTQHKSQQGLLPWRDVVRLKNNLMVKVILVCDLEELKMKEMKDVAIRGPGSSHCQCKNCWVSWPKLGFPSVSVPWALVPSSLPTR